MGGKKANCFVLFSPEFKNVRFNYSWILYLCMVAVIIRSLILYTAKNIQVSTAHGSNIC